MMVVCGDIDRRTGMMGVVGVVLKGCMNDERIIVVIGTVYVVTVRSGGSIRTMV